MPGREIIIERPFMVRDNPQNFYPNLSFVAAQFELDDTEIDLASTNIGNVAQSDWEKRTLLAAWLDRIDAEQHYDFVIFDCPPATKIVSQNALACSDSYVIPVIPDELSSRGVTHFQALVSRKIDTHLEYLKETARIPEEHIPRNYVKGTKIAAIAPYLAKQSPGAASGFTNIHTERMAALRKQFGDVIIKTVGKNYIGIPEAVNAGWPVWNYWGNNARPSVSAMMRKICVELKERIEKS